MCTYFRNKIQVLCKIVQDLQENEPECDLEIVSLEDKINVYCCVDVLLEDILEKKIKVCYKEIKGEKKEI